jgi:hypothetical protein
MDQSPPREYCLLWIQHWALCMTKSEWASWIQGIGTLLAIAASGLAIWWQVKKQTSLSIQTQVENLRILALAAFHLRSDIDLLSECLFSRTDSAVVQQQIQHRLQRLEELPMLALVDPHVAWARDTLATAYTRFIATNSGVLSLPTKDLNAKDSTLASIELHLVSAAAADLEHRIALALRERGSEPPWQLMLALTPGGSSRIEKPAKA